LPLQSVCPVPVRSQLIALSPHRPNPFPLFPHLPNMPRTATPATPILSYAYFTLSCTPRVHPTPASPYGFISLDLSSVVRNHSSLSSLESTAIRIAANAHSKRLPKTLNPLGATFTKKQGVGLASFSQICDERRSRHLHQQRRPISIPAPCRGGGASNNRSSHRLAHAQRISGALVATCADGQNSHREQNYG
jgi:hypothetical protein